jgi:hypothetical protein
MTTTIRKPKAQEKSMVGIPCTFLDETESPMIPKTIRWTLTDKNGTVINDRENILFPSPASEIKIVLTNDDLKILDHEQRFKDVVRKLLVSATYDSEFGLDLPLNDELTFYLENLAYPE